MVDKISVNPLSVRGAGDIVSPKTTTDFDVYNTVLSSSSEDVDGAVMTVYTVSYVSGTYFTVSSESIVPVGESSFTVTAVLKKNSDDSVVSGASVSCTVNGETVLTGTTDSNGSVSFTIPTMEDVSKYTVKLVYSGSAGVGGAFKVTGLICVDLTTLALALTGNKTIIKTSESCALLATLTGVGVDGELIGVPGQTVTVYEEYTPALDITATPQIIQSNDNTSIILQLKDEEDGSLVRESGLTIDLYSNVTVFKSFTLTSDKEAVSYYDNESAVLTATYLEDNVGVSGKSVVFKNGNTVLDTVVTDSNGEAKYTYASQGVGDVTITAECMNLQETYVLEDAIYYNTMTSTPNGWTIPASANATYSSNGMTLLGSSWSDCYLEVPLTKPYTVEFDLIDYSGITTYLHYIYDSTKATRHISMYRTDDGTTVLDQYPDYNNYFFGSIPKGSHVKLEINNDNVKLYVDDVLELTKSYTLPSSTIFGVTTSTGRSTTWKNMKIKPL